MNTEVQKVKEKFLNSGPTSIEERKRVLKKLHQYISSHVNEIKDALHKDLNKPAFEAFAAEIGYILTEISTNLKNLDEWSEAIDVDTPIELFPGKSQIYYDPYGTVLVFSPWNYPFQLLMSPAIAAWSAGNNLVLKPSELTPNTTQVLKDLVHDVFPSERVVLIEGDATVANKLLDEKFDYIFFTGSTKVGKIVMQKAANFLTPVTLELGGKSPCIVDLDANIEQAARRICWGKFMNAGQTCVAPDFILVHKTVKAKLIDALKKTIEEFYGQDQALSSDYARIVSVSHLSRLKSLIADQKILFGGKIDEVTKYFSPTLIDEPAWDSTLMQEEIFGPILPIISFENKIDFSMKLKQRGKPLAFYYFSSDEKKQEEILSEFSFGGGCINDTVIHLANTELPFGGVGDSGMGSYHGKKSFLTFCHEKSIFRQSLKIDIPLRYPPYKDKVKWLKMIQK